MKKLGVGSLLVTGSDSKPFAIITKSDIVFKCVALGKQCAVGQIASKPLKTITPEADLSEAAESMGRNKVTRLVVVRGTEVVGVISEQDIIRISPSLYDLVAENARRS
jgi:CBS domain-containing protein